MSGGMFAPAGLQAERILSLWWLLLGVAMVVLIAVTAVGLVAVLRAPRRADAGPSRGTIVMPARERGTVLIVAGSTVLTALVLIGLLTASVLTGRAIGSLHADDAPTVELVGHQWWWEVRYPDAAPANLVITANEIHVPVGRPVRIRTMSRDVIHSFWVPSLHGKRDLIPGHVSDLWLRADRAGAFPGQCAEYCGYQHALMRLLVVAEPPDRFQAWLGEQRQSPPAPTSESERHGQTVFLANQCALCHAVQGTAAGARTGPDLSHLATRQTIAAGVLANTPANLAAWIVDPQGVKPGSLMPATSLSSDDLGALVQYLRTLR